MSTVAPLAIVTAESVADPAPALAPDSPPLVDESPADEDCSPDVERSPASARRWLPSGTRGGEGSVPDAEPSLPPAIWLAPIGSATFPRPLDGNQRGRSAPLLLESVGDKTFAAPSKSWSFVQSD